jgi:hypothetical protein
MKGNIMKAKLTNSRDGVKRFSMKVEFRVSRSDLIGAMTLLLAEDFNLNLYAVPKSGVWNHLMKLKVLDEVRRHDIWKKMKDCLYWRGDQWHYALENIDREEELMEFCKSHINRYFPEFKEDI